MSKRRNHFQEKGSLYKTRQENDKDTLLEREAGKRASTGSIVDLKKS